MRPKVLLTRILLTLLTGALLPVALSAQAVTGPERDKLLQDANAKYYSLSRAGLESFTCKVQPNWNSLSWDKITAPMLEPPEHYAALIAKLRKAPPITFTFTAGKRFTLADLDIPDAPGVTAEEKDSADTLQGTFGAVLKGFMDIWDDLFNGEMIWDLHTTIRRTPDGYTLHQDSTADAKPTDKKPAVPIPTLIRDITLDPSLLLMTSSMDMPESHLSMHARLSFTPSPNGYLLTGFDGDGSTDLLKEAAITDESSMTTSFGPVDGLQLPTGFSFLRTVTGNGKSGKLTAAVAFTGCTVRKKS